MKHKDEYYYLLVPLDIGVGNTFHRAIMERQAPPAIVITIEAEVPCEHNSLHLDLPQHSFCELISPD